MKSLDNDELIELFGDLHAHVVSCESVNDMVTCYNTKLKDTIDRDWLAGRLNSAKFNSFYLVKENLYYENIFENCEDE